MNFSDRIIFHIDVNSAYLSWTAIRMLQLGEIEDKMWPLPVEDLFMVGRATQQVILKIGD